MLRFREFYTLSRQERALYPIFDQFSYFVQSLPTNLCLQYYAFTLTRILSSNVKIENSTKEGESYLVFLSRGLHLHPMTWQHFSKETYFTSTFYNKGPTGGYYVLASANRDRSRFIAGPSEDGKEVGAKSSECIGDYSAIVISSGNL